MSDPPMASPRKVCHHYPIIGNKRWRIVEQTMDMIVRQCTKCGQIDISRLHHGPTYYTEGWRRKVEAAQRSPDTLQPWKNGKPNEDFAKAYQHEPDKLKSIYSKQELKQLGYNKLDDPSLS